MSDPNPDDPPSAAPPGGRETRSIEASRRLSQLLSRPLGAPAPPGEAPPYVPRVERPAPPPPAPAAEPADDTASAPAPPAAPAPDPEPHLPWFGRPAEPAPPHEPLREPEHAAEPPSAEAPPRAEEPAPEAPAPAPHLDDDLFDRHDAVDHHAPVAPPGPIEPAGEVWPLEPPRARAWPFDAAAEPPAPADRVPEWAWPSALEAREPPPLREPARPAPDAPAAAAPAAAKPLDPEAARALARIRRLMLISNLFMLIAIAAVLGVVGYRVFRSEPAPPPAPPPAPVVAPAPKPPDIPLDMTLTLPRGARIVQTAVAGDRLVITLEIDGASEVRTFDVKTLQPAGRLSFGNVP